jgi:hypothetical protein
VDFLMEDHERFTSEVETGEVAEDDCSVIASEE